MSGFWFSSPQIWTYHSGFLHEQDGAELMFGLQRLGLKTLVTLPAPLELTLGGFCERSCSKATEFRAT